MSDMVHLHSHSLFSILDGVCSPKDYFKFCYDHKYKAHAMTEHGVFSSIPDAYFESREFGIKMIPGVEFHYNDYEKYRKYFMNLGYTMNQISDVDIDFRERLGRNRHITVLAKNDVGYRNLLQINKIAQKENLFRKLARVNMDLLRKYGDGLIILSGCLNGTISHEILKGNIYTSNNKSIISAYQYLKMFKERFKEDFYIEIQMPCIENFDDKIVFSKLIEMAIENNIKLVITNDTHYLTRKDFEVQKVMMAISQGTTVDDPNLFHVNSSEQFMKTREELRDTFLNKGYCQYADIKIFETACDTTLEITDKCNDFKPNMEPKLPKIDNADEKLIKLAYSKLVEKGLDKDDKKYICDGKEVTHKDQMIIELERFIEKGFSSYFLIMRNLIEHSRSLGYDVGPGRGSSSGSLVCYLLDIVSINSLKWGLSFDRFLSAARGGKMLKVTME